MSSLLLRRPLQHDSQQSIPQSALQARRMFLQPVLQCGF
jgi:hypothetical protein